MKIIIHKDLSYAVKGVLFDVYNALGPMLPERFYQAALAIALQRHKDRRGNQENLRGLGVSAVRKRLIMRYREMIAAMQSNSSQARKNSARGRGVGPVGSAGSWRRSSSGVMRLKTRA